MIQSKKLQVCFAKEPYKRDYILQKRTIFIINLSDMWGYESIIGCDMTQSQHMGQ